MKFAIIASIVGAASAFAPAHLGASTGVRSSVGDVTVSAEKSEALPFLPYPPNLKGYLGDVGFDPLRISDYVPMDYLREAELKHGRICMMAWVGYVGVDLGWKVYPVPEGWEGVTSATAHDAAVKTGSMGQLLLFFAIAEMISWISISQMLQGSGREPGDFSFGIQYLKGKSEEEVNRLKLQELKNGRLAMMAFSGVVTQSVLNDVSFPYF